VTTRRPSCSALRVRSISGWSTRSVAVGELVTASYVAGATSVEFGLELHADHVAAVVRDDRRPAGSESSFGGTGVRDAFLDALTTSRSVVEDAVGTVNVARFSLAYA